MDLVSWISPLLIHETRMDQSSLIIKMTSNSKRDVLGYTIRPASAEDIPSVLWMIQLFAEHQNEPCALEIMKVGEKESTYPPDLRSSKMVRNERLVGYALYFFNYSTWEGRVLYLEDLFVRQQYRNIGLGTAFIRECAKVAKTKDRRRMVWQVLDSNTKAFDLYERIGGKCLREWLTIRMDKKGMENFISSSE
ncbi:thialysine N-epsilon-acetyltransferase-like isoform X2 [Halichondria panicea]|uniref:thialysine N-epsilon-acetyltransferase-like isoform X2 n=1 Tax=Halichondria panicea TaxID=6063 RepID=UPI00312B5CEE